MNNDFITGKLNSVSELSGSIASDVGDAKGALAALLTDKDHHDLYGDLQVLMDALESIYQSANMIGWTAAEANRLLEKEDNVTK